MAHSRNQVRIIGGKWKRRKLTFPNRPELRPSLDRARETLFNWLMPKLSGSRCLDLFAGSGALGFEAASRGATAVTLVENDSLVAHALEKNRQHLKALECQVIRASAIPWLRIQQQQWDVVFLDPPFKSTLAVPAIERLLAQDLLHPSAFLILESDAKKTPEFTQLKVVKEKSFGATRIQILNLL